MSVKKHPMEAPAYSGFYWSTMKFHDAVSGLKPEVNAVDLVSIWVAGFTSGLFSALKGGGGFNHMHLPDRSHMTSTDVEALYGDVKQIGKDMDASLAWFMHSPGGQRRVGQGRRPEYPAEQRKTETNG